MKQIEKNPIVAIAGDENDVVSGCQTVKVNEPKTSGF